MSRHDVTVFGATGYTGRKIAARLVAAGLTPQLAARHPGRLDALNAELGGACPTRVADVADPASLAAMAASTRVCVSAAGPFVTMGPPALDACLSAGTHWLDLTGEPAWIHAAQARDADARAAGAVVVPSCAFESAIASLATAVAGDGFAAIDDVEITYFMDRFPSSTGTKRSVIKVLADPPQDPPPFRVRRDAWPWSPQAPRARKRLWRVSYPGAEVPVVRWQTQTSVELLFALPGPTGPLLKCGLRPAMFALRHGGAALAQPFLGFSRSGPSDAALAKTRFTVVATARGRRDGAACARTCFVDGADPYGLTAEIITHAVQAVLADGHDLQGVRAPAQVVDPRATLEALGLRCTVEDPQEATCPVPS